MLQKMVASNSTAAAAGKALPSSKDVRKGPSAPKGFGGGAAKPSRGRKKKAAAPPRKKTQGELLWELQKRQVLPAPDLRGSAHNISVRCGERPAHLDRAVGMLAAIALTAMCLPAADRAGTPAGAGQVGGIRS